MANKAKIPLRVRLSFWRRNWIWLAWLLLLPAAWLLIPADRLATPVTGLVTAEAETVGAIETVRIRALPVVVGQKVFPGDILVEVEGFAERKERLDALDYAVKTLDIRQAAQKQAQDLFALELRARQSFEDTRVALAEKEMEQARDTVALDSLRQEAGRLEPLVARGLLSDTELVRLRPQIAALAETLARRPALIGALRERLASAEGEIARVEKWKTENLLPLSAAQEETLAAVHATAGDLGAGAVSFLRATTTGVVSRIQYAVGDVVTAGTPILRVTSDSFATITGMLRPHQATLVEEGMTLAVVAPFRPGARYYAEVTRVEPELLDFTDPFTPLSRNRFPTRGRRVTLVLEDADHGFIPGESVTILLPAPTLRQRISRFMDQIFWRNGETQAGRE